MYTRMIHPESLSAEELDAFLGQGWFRMRQAVFTCRFVMSDGHLRSAVWIRCRLQGYRFKKSLRRVLNRNDRAFSCRLVPAVVDAEKEALYSAYRDDFDGELAPDLESVLFDDDGQDVYHTACFEVRDGDRLVAFSFFDRGRDSIASIIGVFDPEYRRYGLGLYTMLLEVRHGIEVGMRWFYPGYVAPGCAAFDYKLRLGAAERFDPNLARWGDYDSLQPEELPAERILAALADFEHTAQQAGIATEQRLYPPYAVVGMDARGDGYLTEPIFVEVPGVTRGAARLLVSFDLQTERYSVGLYARVRDLRRHFGGGVEHPTTGPRPCHDLLRRVRRLGSTGDASEALALATRRAGRSVPVRSYE